MKQPRIRAKGLQHVVTLRCTHEDLHVLAELARDHDLHRPEVPFWRVGIGEVEVRFCLDHDEELSARAASRQGAKVPRNGDGENNHEEHAPLRSRRRDGEGREERMTG